MKRATLAIVLALLVPGSAALGATDHVLYAWTELVPTGVAPSGIVARAITDGAACPTLAVSGARAATISMHAVTPAAGVVGFASIRICRASIPGGATSARAGAHRLPLLGRAGPIAIVGDTGCAIEAPDAKGKQKPQHCNDPTKWPVAAIAARIAAARPRFVIHVGDFVYREAACLPQEQAKCGGSPAPNPTGNPDTWAIWQTEFFGPAAPMLAAAPLVVLRGNHEQCTRAGNGYVLLLDPGEVRADACAGGANHSVFPPYAIDTHGLRLVVIDSAEACDYQVGHGGLYGTVFREAARLAPGSAPRWLLSHRPLWGYVTNQSLEDVYDNQGCLNTPPAASAWKNVELESTARGLYRYQAVVSGHVHAFEAVQIPGRPAQLILGNGGTQLNGGLGKNHVAPPVAPKGSDAPSYANAIDEFGYGLARQDRRGWTLEAYDPTGKRQTTCRFGGPAPMRCT